MYWKNIKNYEKDCYSRRGITDFNIFRRWAESKKLITWSSSRGNDMVKVVKKAMNNYDKRNEPPYLDHLAIFKNSDKKVFLTFQPYGDLKHMEKEIDMWCKKNDLIVEFFDSDESWYSPGETSLIVITNS